METLVLFWELFLDYGFRFGQARGPGLEKGDGVVPPLFFWAFLCVPFLFGVLFKIYFGFNGCFFNLTLYGVSQNSFPNGHKGEGVPQGLFLGRKIWEILDGFGGKLPLGFTLGISNFFFPPKVEGGYPGWNFLWCAKGAFSLFWNFSPLLFWGFTPNGGPPFWENFKGNNFLG